MVRNGLSHHLPRAAWGVRFTPRWGLEVLGAAAAALVALPAGAQLSFPELSLEVFQGPSAAAGTPLPGSESGEAIKHRPFCLCESAS